MIPDRYKLREQYSVGEVLAELQATRRGNGYRVETANYARYRRDALAAAGLRDEARELDPDNHPDPADWTPEQHMQHIRRWT